MRLLREQGKMHVEIGQITGCTRSYISTMLKRLKGAPELLEGMSRGGRPQGSLRALSAKEERRAQQLICGKCPDQLSLPFALWTRAAIRELIRREFGVRLSIRGVGEYLARWGYTPQKAARRAYERDDAAVKDWLSIEYPKIKARAKRENAEISWGDETGVRSDQSRHRGYAPPGQAPVVKIPARRKSLSLIATVTNQGKVRFMIYPGGLSPERLILFMQRLIKDAHRKVFLIIDNLNVHKAKAVREWLNEHRDRIEVFFLPPYSPELNPTEYFNGDLKGEIQRGIPPKDATDLKRTMLSHSRRIQKSPERVRSYFRNRNIRYAA
jgi:transposase